MKNKNILVFGLAKSGYHVAKLLYKENNITVIDQKDDDKEKINDLESLGIKFIKTSNASEYINSDIDLLIKNPGIEPSNDALVKARNLNIPIVNEMEVAYHYLPSDVKIIGVTGSNGKTTTTTIIYELLSHMMDNVHLGGNIGYPLSEIVGNVKSNDILVLEISDHQLYDLNDFKTNISVLTNLCPTHLDFHGNYENYINVKKKIFNHHTKNDIAIINKSNNDSLKITDDINSTKKYFCGCDAYIDNDVIFVNDEEIINIKDILVKGEHNYENIMASLLVFNEFGIDKSIVKEVLGSFKGVEHRLEFVKKYNNIEIYNDSKATNPTSTLIAINTFNKPIHLILGGMERKQDFNELNSSMNKVKCVYAIGETEDRINDWCQSIDVDCVICNTLDVAVKKIREKVNDSEIVLLSTASASWDQYDKFETRGDEFKKHIAIFFE